MPIAAISAPPQAPAAPAPAIVRPAIPECRLLSQEDARIALERVRQSIPSTPLDSASPSEICGLIRIKMASGKVVYTDPTGRYLLFTFALDLHRGSPADNDEHVERVIDERSQYPKEALPNVTPPMDESLLPRQSPMPK